MDCHEPSLAAESIVTRNIRTNAPKLRCDVEAERVKSDGAHAVQDGEAGRRSPVVHHAYRHAESFVVSPVQGFQDWDAQPEGNAQIRRGAEQHIAAGEQTQPPELRSRSPSS